jgi:anti-sigma factor RsiW
LEARLFEYLDGQLPPAEAKAMEAHLALCPECRQTAQQWKDLDVELAAQLAPPQLSTGFSRKLQERLQKEGSAAPTAISPERKARLTEEFDSVWARDSRRTLRSMAPFALDFVGYGALAAVGSGLLFRLLAKYGGAPSSNWLSTVQPWLLPVGVGLAALVLVAAMLLATRTRVSRLLNAL